MHPIQKKLLQLSKIRDLSTLSIREIGRQIGDTDRVHPQQVKYHLQKLVDGGHLDMARKPQGHFLKTADGLPQLIAIPILGAASCGPAAIFADEDIRGYLRISSSLLHSKNYRALYALQASGDSMNDAHVDGDAIKNGDYVIVDHSRRSPKTGEYVVAVDESNKANIKKLFLDHLNEQIALVSESTQDYAPIFIDPKDQWDTLIRGTVVQVVKNPAFA